MKIIINKDLVKEIGLIPGGEIEYTDDVADYLEASGIDLDEKIHDIVSNSESDQDRYLKPCIMFALNDGSCRYLMFSDYEMAEYYFKDLKDNKINPSFFEVGLSDSINSSSYGVHDD